LYAVEHNPQEFTDLLSRRAFPYLILLSIITIATAAAAESIPTATTTSHATSAASWGDTLMNLPVVRWFFPPQLPPVPPEPPVASMPCGVAPLPAITDEEALKFESGGSKDVGGLMPAMASALEKFKTLVTSVGGSFELKSAYRPPAYQAHLQQVWYKWMELRNNHDIGCQTLRAAVGEEFSGHHLLETQKPVTSSDHTRGLAFDATVTMPAKPVLKKRRVSLDKLALLAGIRRPDILHDPVHFKLWAARVTVRGTRGVRGVRHA
jgi:hypothetical protein